MTVPSLTRVFTDNALLDAILVRVVELLSAFWVVIDERIDEPQGCRVTEVTTVAPSPRRENGSSPMLGLDRV